MKDIANWINLQIKNRPFFSALVILILVIVPGYARVESISTKASDAAVSSADTSKQLADVVAAQTEQNKATALANCQTRNTASKNGRARFDQLFNGIEAIFTSTPGQTDQQKQQAMDFVEKLRTQVPLDPSKEDVDCNGDKVLGSQDYG